MKDTIIIHQSRDPYADYDFRNTEESEETFDNPCPICGKSLDYEEDVQDMCLCEPEGTVNHHFDGILAMVKPSHLTNNK